MSKGHVKKQIRKLKELADKSEDSESRELLMIFHDVFKFLVERVSPYLEIPEVPEETNGTT